MGWFSGTNSTVTTVYTGIALQTSAQGVPVTLMWGKNRIKPNLFWYNNFHSEPVNNGKGGSKGGGKGGQNRNYFAAIMLGLCDGPIHGIEAIWADQTRYVSGTGLSKLNLEICGGMSGPPYGTAGQPTWPYLISNYPGQALPYSDLAYVSSENYALGQSASLPNHNFEVAGRYAYDFAHGSNADGDVNMGFIIPDLLTNPQYSIALDPSSIDATSLAFYQLYLFALGVYFSPVLDSQEQLSSILDRWASLTNTWIFWSGGTLKFVPLGDSQIINGSYTYNPNVTAVYDLTYNDFIIERNKPPLQVTRVDPADCPNHVKLEIKDRNNSYNSAIVEWQDQGLVDQFGQIDASVMQAHEITYLATGAIVAQLAGQRAAYIRNTYSFKLNRGKGSILEPGDLCTLTDPNIGLTLFPVRIRTLEEDKDGNWQVDAEEFPGVIGTGGDPGQQGSSGSGGYDKYVDPGDINPPAIFEPTPDLAGSATPQIWLAASGDANWGGCSVSVSFDNVNYAAVGVIAAPALQGLLTANLPAHADPDLVNTLSIDLTESVGIMPINATHADADAFRTLCLICPAYSATVPPSGELITYGAVSATGTYTSDITYLRRGLFGSSGGSHSTGDFFTRINLGQVGPNVNSIITYFLPPNYVGGPIYFKFQSFNIFGNELQDISTVTAYSYTPSGQGYGGGSGGTPTDPTTLTGNGYGPSGDGWAVLNWDDNPANDNVQYYTIYRRVHAVGSFFKVATSSVSNYTDGGASANTYDYVVTAHNAVGDSGNSNTATVTVP